MAAPTHLADAFNKNLANKEPSTHGVSRTLAFSKRDLDLLLKRKREFAPRWVDKHGEAILVGFYRKVRCGDQIRAEGNHFEMRAECGLSSPQVPIYEVLQLLILAIGGEGGIRTHGTLAGSLVFKTRALNHSATSPNLVSALGQI